MNPALHSSARHDWETPPDLIAKLQARYGRFTLDPCALPGTAKAPTYYTPAEDGLAQEWSGLVFMNPPYGRELPKWVAKARAEADAGRATVVALIPARPDTSYWHDHIFGVADEVDFIRGRIRFLRDGQPADPAPFPSAIVVWRARE